MSTTESASILTGKVKWFNSKAGYGFITVIDDGELLNKDIFVHYSSIRAESSHYKYLTQGEYVEFSLTKPSNDKHEFHAVDVTGIRGGLILCETRRLHALSGKSDEHAVDSSESPRETPREAKPKAKPRGPPKDSEGFTSVKRSHKRVSTSK